MGVSLHRPHIPGAEIFKSKFQIVCFFFPTNRTSNVLLFLGINNSVIVTFLNLLLTRFSQEIIKGLHNSLKQFYHDYYNANQNVSGVINLSYLLKVFVLLLAFYLRIWSYNAVLDHLQIPFY